MILGSLDVSGEWSVWWYKLWLVISTFQLSHIHDYHMVVLP